MMTNLVLYDITLCLNRLKSSYQWTNTFEPKILEYIIYLKKVITNTTLSSKFLARTNPYASQPAPKFYLLLYEMTFPLSSFFRNSQISKINVFRWHLVPVVLHSFRFGKVAFVIISKIISMMNFNILGSIGLVHWIEQITCCKHSVMNDVYVLINGLPNWIKYQLNTKTNR